MPIVASATFRVNGNDDGTVTRIQILEEVNRCGCVSASALAAQLGRPADSVKDTLRSLSGGGAISCSDDGSVCCADKVKLQEFAGKLRRLKDT